MGNWWEKGWPLYLSGQVVPSCRCGRLRWRTHLIWLTASLPDSGYHYQSNLCCLTLNRFTPHQPRGCCKAPWVFPNSPAGNPLPRHTETNGTKVRKCWCNQVAKTSPGPPHNSPPPPSPPLLISPSLLQLSQCHHHHWESFLLVN